MDRTAVLHDGYDPECDRLGLIKGSIKDDLERFVSLLTKWQFTHNLVSRASLGEVWTRHVSDSLQLLDHAPSAYQSWFDLGSGAGFPGLVIAIANKNASTRRFFLIESNLKKVAFLRAAIRQAGVNADVVAERIETAALRHDGRADVVSARALAPVAAICAYAEPLLNKTNGVLLMLKGQDFVREIDDAAKSWDFHMVSTPSVTDAGGRVLALRNLRRKVKP